jgi:RNA polymerase sigma-70 factor (ECF subfamily)
MLNTKLRIPIQSDNAGSSRDKEGYMTPIESFEAFRPYLFSIAYRMLGSVMDAEDMVQETYLRYQAVPPDDILSLKAYLTTILTRLCIDQLQLAYRKRETYIGPWLPEPIITAGTHTPTIEEDAVMRESLSLAFLVVLEKLQPVERAIFLLREVFDYDYKDIAAIVNKKEAACRQIFRRVKQHIAERPANKSTAPQLHRQLLKSFLEAVQAGNTNGLIDLLTEDVTLVADGGGKIPGAATHPVMGQSDVAQFAIGASKRFLPAAYRVELSEINFQPAIVARTADQALVVMTIEVEADRVKIIRFMANPEKIAHL